MTEHEIFEAFCSRVRPHVQLVSEQLSPHEAEDLQAVMKKDNMSLECCDLERHFEFIYWLSPEAFCYYLPGIIAAQVRGCDAHLSIFQALVGMLNLSPDPAMWNKFFSDRWRLLTSRECETVQNWLIELSELESSVFDEDELMRGYEVLDQLRKLDASNV